VISKKRIVGPFQACIKPRLPMFDIVDVAARLNLIPPIAEQCLHKCVTFSSHESRKTLTDYSMFHRERPEKEYACVYLEIRLLVILTDMVRNAVQSVVSELPYWNNSFLSACGWLTHRKSEGYRTFCLNINLNPSCSTTMASQKTVVTPFMGRSRQPSTVFDSQKARKRFEKFVSLRNSLKKV
jgi:hypothetical protein